MLVRPNTASRVAARSAFTLLEVLIVVAILVVLASVSSIYVFKFLHDAKVDAAKVSANNIAKAIQAYEVRNGAPPDSLQVLIQPPEGGRPYLEGGQTALIDPWGKQFQYDPSGQHNGGTKPDVFTIDPDSGQPIGNWK
jgi:general secretion pathway protein G